MAINSDPVPGSIHMCSFVHRSCPFNTDYISTLTLTDSWKLTGLSFQDIPTFYLLSFTIVKLLPRDKWKRLSCASWHSEFFLTLSFVCVAKYKQKSHPNHSLITFHGEENLARQTTSISHILIIAEFLLKLILITFLEKQKKKNFFF